MSQQTDIDFTDKQPTALMRLEAVLLKVKSNETDQFDAGWNAALAFAIIRINQMKPFELADLKRSFCEGGIETESAETWAKKWKQTEQ
jgi:hypothetical protein